ncbi:hypothetical protein BDV25DRAFT_141499 [Aspergillus avenaceus]|uniref:Uncharacterized protein n=1 Tax=Aspergillus avenaceus TaxID=36643 RepID=A0A5N6TRC5_ASPAV|nr:hypothetical protein BDV25DRAFT_141499 [Aspergillus avenaceus]
MTSHKILISLLTFFILCVSTGHAVPSPNEVASLEETTPANLNANNNGRCVGRCLSPGFCRCVPPPRFCSCPNPGGHCVCDYDLKSSVTSQEHAPDKGGNAVDTTKE